MQHSELFKYEANNNLSLCSISLKYCKSELLKYEAVKNVSPQVLKP